MFLQSTPHNALGDPGLSSLLSVALAIVPAVVVIVARRFDVDLRRTVVVGGAMYGGVLLSVWAGIRVLFWRFAAEFPESIPILLFVVLAAGTVFFLQWSAAAVLFLSYRLQSAVVWLFGVTWVTSYAWFFVGGEAGATFYLFIWAFSIGPATLGALVIVVGGEFVIRRRVLSDGVFG